MKRHGQGITFGSRRGRSHPAAPAWWPWLGAGVCAVALVASLSLEAGDAKPSWVLFFAPSTVAGALIGRIDALVLPVCAVAALSAAGGSMPVSDIVEASVFAGLIAGGLARAVFGGRRDAFRR